MTEMSDAEVAAPRTFDPVRFALGAFAAVGVVLWVVAFLSHRFLPPDPLVRQSEFLFAGDALIGMWVKFDAGWYRLIADEGYSFVSVDLQAPVAFFPAYPLLMRWVGFVLGGHPFVAGVLVTVASGLGAVALFSRWCADRLSSPAVRFSVVALIVYPFAFFLFGAVYADALFLVAAVGAFVLLERDHPVLAGLAGAVATATRPVGFALVVGLVVLAVVRRGGWRRLRPADAGVLLSAGGLAAWMTYLWVNFGDPLVFSKIQKAWGQESGPATWFKFDLFDRVRAVACHTRGWLGGPAPTCGPEYGSELLYTLGIVLQGALVVAALVAVPWIIRRFGVAYGLYTAAVVAPALLGSQDFQGSGRYLLAAFPVFALVGAAAERRPAVGRVAMACSAVLLVVFTSLFARGYYVS